MMATTMTPERWQRVTDTLNKALELPAPERDAYLCEIAATDPDLHREVVSLLGSHQKAGAEFLNVPALQALPAVADQPQRETMLGRRLGAYQIVEQIGEGGMGEVYRAFRADDQYRKEVALKVIRAGEDSGFVVSRFKNERQILASLDHPNIARLLDGGTTDEGLPYLVMELIEGESIIQYCDHHHLGTNERLRLFLQVCSAVQFAHQRLIIHRDIKPGNILVTADGTPKLLDFGIAKILNPEAAPGQFEPTMTLFRLLTPGYASPEQLKDQTITTAADIYSLGIVLYELLTGSHPHRVEGDSPQKISHAVCEVEPRKPSSVVHRRGALLDAKSGAAEPLASATPERLSKRLRGDLDNIVLMALRKEPQRRYASVEQFAEDIRRHLDNLPVVARKDTVGYRSSKFVARHRAAVAAAAIVVLTLLAGLVVTLREAQVARQQAAIAREQRARAERRFNDVRKLANSLMFEIHDSIADLPGATQARKLLVSRALEYLDSLSKEAGGDASLQRELAAAYDRVGNVLGYTGAANLGDFAGATQANAKALAIRESLAAANPTDQKLQTELTDEYWRMMFVLKDTGDFAGALQISQRALPLIQRIAAGKTDPALQDRLAGFYWLTGTVLEAKGDAAHALRNYRQGAAIREPIAAESAHNTAARVHLVADYNGIAKMLARTGQLDEAIPMAAKATGIIKKLAEANPNSATLREFLAESYDISGDLMLQKGDIREAASLEQQAHTLYGELRSQDPSNRLAADNLAFSDLAMGRILVRKGKIGQALQSERGALAIFQSEHSASLWTLTGLSQSYYDLGMTYTSLADRSVSPADKMRNCREALNWYQKARDVWTQMPNHANADAFGQDQASRISEGMAKCDAELRQLTAHAGTP